MSRIEDGIVELLQRQDVVLLRCEVAPLGSASQVGRVLAKLVREGKLVRVGIGLYARTRLNKFTHTMTPAAPLESIAREVFQKLGIEVTPGRAAREYNAGLTTQIPMQPVVCTPGRRIRRRIQVGKRVILYEK